MTLSIATIVSILAAIFIISLPLAILLAKDLHTRPKTSMTSAAFENTLTTLSYGVIPRINDTGFYIAEHTYDPSRRATWFSVIYDGPRPVVATDMRSAKRKIRRLMERKYSALFDMKHNAIEPPNEHRVGVDMGALVKVD